METCVVDAGVSLSHTHKTSVLPGLRIQLESVGMHPTDGAQVQAASFVEMHKCSTTVNVRPTRSSALCCSIPLGTVQSCEE